MKEINELTMDTLNEKLKVVAEYDGYKHPERYWWFYTSDWRLQIPVWAKLYKTGKLSREIIGQYSMCVCNAQPAEGFDIIVSIIKRIT